MSPQFLTDGNTRPRPWSSPPPDSRVRVGTRRVLSTLRFLAGLFLAPLLLLGFLAALTDFGLFRLRDFRAGHPNPKGLWEF